MFWLAFSAFIKKKKVIILVRQTHYKYIKLCFYLEISAIKQEAYCKRLFLCLISRV